MPVLIIGAGLVGSQIARLEIERGERPVILERSPQWTALEDIADLGTVNLHQGDLLNPYDLTRVIREERITHIIHTVANPMLTPGAQRDPYNATQLNIMGTMNVFEAARILGIERVVWSSTSVLYLHMVGGQDRGAYGMEEAWPRTSTFYATAKQTCENLGLNYAQAFGLDVIAVRYAAVFGPWKGAGGGGPTTGLFRGLVEKALAGEESSLADRRIEFVYSKDAALGTVLACHAENLKDRVFNIGMGKIWDSHEIASTLTELVPGARTSVEAPVAGGGQPAPPEEKPMDPGRAKEQLGYTPQFPMPKALADYVSWVRSVAS